MSRDGPICLILSSSNKQFFDFRHLEDLVGSDLSGAYYVSKKKEAETALKQVSYELSKIRVFRVIRYVSRKGENAENVREQMSYECRARTAQKSNRLGHNVVVFSPYHIHPHKNLSHHSGSVINLDPPPHPTKSTVEQVSYDFVVKYVHDFNNT